MKTLKYICRIIVGVVFIFSATTKGIDPLGFTYKLHDYFQAFHLGFLKEASLPLTILLCTLEFLAGFSVLFNLRIKHGLTAVMILMSFFTALTFILAIKNPVSDCGCFGDVIHLTNWQTFFKNIILFLPVIYLVINRKELYQEKNVIRSWVTLTIATVLFVAFMFYNLRYLPVVDFLPYRIGTYIPDKMIIPEGKQADKYETTLIYEKDGVKKEFTINNYPANDTTWRFVEQKSVLVVRGYQPPIHDFSITTTDNEDITQTILSSDRPTMLMITKKLKEADPGLLRNGFNLGYYCKGNMINFYVLTASGRDEIRRFSNGITFCFTDETTLKTMIRSNPGYMLLVKGRIAGKWSWANVPDKITLGEFINKQ
ncbi:MAG: BT_3928 family protein [Bacteroidales bacterium]|jgi:hypothetical protein